MFLHVNAGDSVVVKLEPDQVIGKANRSIYGVNVFYGFDEKNATNLTYQKVVKSLGCEAVRFHNGGMFKDGSKSWQDANWLDIPNKRWNENKISRILTSLRALGEKRLMTVIYWPPWMDEDNDDRLDEGREADYAAFCADLVRIVNIQNKAGFGYWEVLNEIDLHKSYSGDLSPLVKAVNLAAEAMKKVDPTIKISGNAWAWAPQKLTETFVVQTPLAHDFFSYHSYTMSAPNPSQMEIRIQGPKILGSLQKVSALPALAGKEVWLDEWNMFGSYRHDEKTKHMRSPTAALYDLNVYKALAGKSMSATICAWNECDGVYGKIGPDYEVRESGKLMAAMNSYFVGDLVATSVSDDEKLLTMAVKNKDGVALAIGNLSDDRLNVELQGPRWKSVERKTRNASNDESSQMLTDFKGQQVEAGMINIYLLRAL